MSRLCVDLQKALSEHIQNVRQKGGALSGLAQNAPSHERRIGVLDEISKQRVKELCDQIAKEQDRHRFSRLISELNQILEDSGTRTSDGADGAAIVDTSVSADKSS